MTTDESYIELFKHDNFQGNSLKIYLRDGGRAYIARTHELFDEASSLKLYAPSNVSCAVFNNYFNNDHGGATDRYWSYTGTGDNPVLVYKSDLNPRQLHDCISAVEWYVDGQISDSRTYETPVPEAGTQPYCVRYVANNGNYVGRRTFYARNQAEADALGVELAGAAGFRSGGVSSGRC